MRLKSPLAEWNRNFALLACAVFSTGIFFGVQLTLYNNFIVERLNIEPHELGYVEALREMPGFLNALFIALMIHLALPVVAGGALIIMGLGIMAYAKVSSVFMLAVFSLIWSFGFHCWTPLQQAMGLAFSPAGKKGRWLGQLRSVNSIAWLLAIGLCMALVKWLDYEGMFVFAGLVTVLGGVALFFADRKRPPVREKGFVVKSRYKIFYALQFLQGCRKQMFITFAFFALVKVHGMPLGTAMKLAMINQVFIFLTGPLMGRMVDRYGERRMLSLSYVCLAFVFLGYAIIQHRSTLYALFCVDNMIFFGGIALTTYVNKIAPEEDIKPTLAMGVTMNHVSSVAAPFVGGMVWHFFGYQIIFFSGAALALISLVVTQWVRPEEQLVRDAAGEAQTAISEAAS